MPTAPIPTAPNAMYGSKGPDKSLGNRALQPPTEAEPPSGIEAVLAAVPGLNARQSKALRAALSDPDIVSQLTAKNGNGGPAEAAGPSGPMSGGGGVSG